MNHENKTRSQPEKARLKKLVFSSFFKLYLTSFDTNVNW